MREEMASSSYFFSEIEGTTKTGILDLRMAPSATLPRSILARKP